MLQWEAAMAKSHINATYVALKAMLDKIVKADGAPLPQWPEQLRHDLLCDLAQITLTLAEANRNQHNDKRRRGRG